MFNGQERRQEVALAEINAAVEEQKVANKEAVAGQSRRRRQSRIGSRSGTILTSPAGALGQSLLGQALDLS